MITNNALLLREDNSHNIYYRTNSVTTCGRAQELIT
jgi:hypothetical protein